MAGNLGLKNLLVISNTFPDESDSYIGGIFIKDQLSCLSKYFENIYVLVPAPLSIATVRKIPLKDYKFQNIHVFFVKYVDFPLFYFYFRDLWVKKEVSKVLSFLQSKNLQFDLIHAHNTWRAGRIAVELKKTFKCPVILTEHTSNVLNEWVVAKQDAQFEKTWKACDAIIRVNVKDTYLFKNAHIPQDRIHIIPNGFKKDLFYPMDTKIVRNRLGLPQNKKILLSVGALVTTKGYPYMFDAMKEIIKKRTDVHLFIIGTGKLKKILQKKVTQANLQNFVTLIGGKPHKEIPLWMNACDVFVFPSIRESFGVVQIEALACGKPVIGTRNGGSEDIIISFEYGFLVDPADSKDLVTNIIKALEVDWNGEAIVAYSRKYEWNNIIPHILSVYENLMYKIN